MRISDWSSDVCSSDLLRLAYDVVLIETVGVGQSETDVAWVADTVVFCVQPGSGDSLQFMKAGIMEIPELAVEIGRASCRESVCRSVSISLVAVSLKKQTKYHVSRLNITDTPRH